VNSAVDLWHIPKSNDSIVTHFVFVLGYISESRTEHNRVQQRIK